MTARPRRSIAPPLRLEVVPGRTLKEARGWLRDHLDEGAECPCCTQRAQVYRRKLHATMARDLIRFWRRFGRDWGHLPDLGGHPGDFAKLAHWGLIEEADESRTDGGRAGWWRVTAQGVLFIAGEHHVHQYVHLYDARRVKPDEGRGAVFSGALVSIETCLGKRFSYADLMEVPL